MKKRTVKIITNTKENDIAEEFLNDGNQEKWENGELGRDINHAVISKSKVKFKEYNTIKSGKYVHLKEDKLDKEFGTFWKLVKYNTNYNRKYLIEYFTSWIKKNKVPIKEICLYLDISPIQYNRIILGEEDITIQKISEIAAIMDKKIKILFE